MSYRFPLFLCRAALWAGALIWGSANAASLSQEHTFSQMNRPVAQPRLAIAPADSRLMWAKLSQILQGSTKLSRSEIEASVGPLMRESLLEGDSSFYAVNGGDIRFFDVTLNLRDRRGLQRFRAARPVDMQGCVGPAQFTSELMSAGWMPGQHDQQSGKFYSFSRHGLRDQVFLYLNHGCLDRVSISTGL